MPVLQTHYRDSEVVGVNSSDYDLTDSTRVASLFRDVRPDVVVHLAALVAGIGANTMRPADFYYRNTLLVAHMFEHAARAGVCKLVYPFGGCSYPADATSPIDETQLWQGYPHQSSAAYSTAKIMGMVAADAYRRQLGLKTALIIPGNMYGEYDNFITNESHVVPAMIRRFHEATIDRVDEVVMWGSGEPLRDFVYAGDVARTLPFFIEDYDAPSPVNISTSSRTSIRELAETIAALMGYEGTIRWDTGKPDGQSVKIFDATRLHALGQSCPTTLRAGLDRTIAWFRANYATHGDGLRL